MIDVTALGELLIDFTQHGKSGQGNDLFECNPGGAPCNVLSMLAKCGKKTAFIGKVGNDIFGTFLKGTIESVGIDTRALALTDDARTTLAFVKHDESGDRSFAFYRNPGADMSLTEADIDAELIKESRIFHFGTLSMTHEGVRRATKLALKIAKENGVLISFDPNLRESLWKSLDEAVEQMKYGCSVCDVIKIEEKELEIISGEPTIEGGVKYLRDNYNIKLITVTCGENGSWAFSGDSKVFVPAMLTEKTVDTTGAGDTFWGCTLNYILNHGTEGIDALSEDELLGMLKFSNAAASLVTTKMGAIRSMPTIEEVENYMA